MERYAKPNKTKNELDTKTDMIMVTSARMGLALARRMTYMTYKT
jgi:hypothetical protein